MPLPGHHSTHGHSSLYNPWLWPDEFKVTCEPATEDGVIDLKIGPLSVSGTANQLRLISQAIDTALLDAERQKVAPWTPEEIMQHAG